MARMKKVLGHEQQSCPTCQQSTTFEVYESWERVSRWTRTRPNLAHRAQCLECGYRIPATSA
jgi:transcription elongation factor Elf1